MNKKIAVLVLLVLLMIGFYLIIKGMKQTSLSQTLGLSTTALPSPLLQQQTKVLHCQMQNSLPDKDCTPGAVFPNVTKEQICQSGYAKSVRNVSTSLKNDVFLEYDITSHTAKDYEVDHLISLELGGSNDLANLWPEPAEPKPGFHEKDKVENYLHDQVCNGTISLQQAQYIIATNWIAVYQQLP